MGYPVSHSRSPVIHRLFAQQTGQDIRYELLRVAPDKLEEAVRQFQRTGGKGLNITAPHKRAVFRFVDHLSARASTAGAVNTLTFRDNEVHGDNTDGIGLLRDLVVNLGLNLEGSNILILGAGGAARGIVGPLLEMRPRGLRVANRTVRRADELAERFEDAGTVGASSFAMVPVDDPYDLVINATTVRTDVDTLPYPEAAVSETTFCYDLSYGASPTPFCAWAREHGAARSVMGWGMLIEQAAESFHIWRDVRPDTKPVLKQMAINA